MSTIALTNQFNDFLIRRVDPYAQAKYRILLRELGDPHGKTALVVGSGSGEFACMLAQRGARVTAIDIDHSSVQLTQATARDCQVSLETQVCTLERFESVVPFDVVVATDVIEHIRDDAFASRKLVNLLKPGGLLVLTVPALQALYGYHDEVLEHFRRYSKGQLGELIARACQAESRRPIWILHRYFGFFLMPVTLMVSCVLRRPYPVQQVGTDLARGRGWIARVLKQILDFEAKFHMPLGTSVLTIVKCAERENSV